MSQQYKETVRISFNDATLFNKVVEAYENSHALWIDGTLLYPLSIDYDKENDDLIVDAEIDLTQFVQ